MGASAKRATVYFDPVMHRALQHKAVETSRSVSELVNDAVQRFLAEDADDLSVFQDRANEPLIPYETILKELKADGLL